MSEIAKPNYEQLIPRIGAVLAEGRNRGVTAINTALVQSYWTSGQHIVEYELQGKERAEYGSNLLDRLVKDLRERYGVDLVLQHSLYEEVVYCVPRSSDTV